MTMLVGSYDQSNIHALSVVLTIKTLTDFES